MKKKNIKPEEVEVVIPKEVEAINICGDMMQNNIKNN